MKIQIAETYQPKYEIQLIHPDYGSEFHTIAAVTDQEEIVFWTDEDYKEYNKLLIESVHEKFNKYGYWHEEIITAVYVIDGEIIRKEIKEEE